LDIEGRSIGNSPNNRINLTRIRHVSFLAEGVARTGYANRWQDEQIMFPVAVCGDDCYYCPRYIATQNRSAKELEKVKELWVRLGLRDSAFPAQDLACLGCKPENKCAYSELRTCVSEKRIGNCGLCDRYPCNLINDAFEKSEKLRSHAARVCKSEEMEVLDKAFFSKKRNLNRIHNEMNDVKRK
jgi:hypothetical protein